MSILFQWFFIAKLSRARAFSIRCNGRPWSVWLRAFLCFCYLSKRSQNWILQISQSSLKNCIFMQFLPMYLERKEFQSKIRRSPINVHCDVWDPRSGPSRWVQKPIQQVARLFRQLVQWYWARFPIATRDPIHSTTLLPSWNFGPSCLRAWYFTGVLSSFEATSCQVFFVQSFWTLHQPSLRDPQKCLPQGISAT